MFGFFAQPIITATRKTRNKLFNIFDSPVVILIYHRVISLPSDPQLLAVTPAHFRAQMQYLKDNFPIIRFEEDWSEVKIPSIAITFDDGYADNVLETLPILEKVGVPATFFVSTGTIGTRKEFWWDELERVLFGDGPFPERYTLSDNRFRMFWPSATASERQALYRELYPLMKKLDAGSREMWLNQLRQWAQAGDEGRDGFRAMTVGELQHLAQSKLVTIGAHTMTHTALSSLSLSAQREEILESKKQLESWLDRKVTVFSYPFGSKSDYTSDTRNLCKAAGFIKAAANFPGQAHRWTDPYQMPRQLVRNWPVEIFSTKISRFWTS